MNIVYKYLTFLGCFVCFVQLNLVIPMQRRYAGEVEEIDNRF